MRCEHEINKVNDQDFLQVFQGSGMGKIEDNLTSADPLFKYHLANEDLEDQKNAVHAH